MYYNNVYKFWNWVHVIVYNIYIFKRYKTTVLLNNNTYTHLFCIIQIFHI